MAKFTQYVGTFLSKVDNCVTPLPEKNTINNVRGTRDDTSIVQHNTAKQMCMGHARKRLATKLVGLPNKHLLSRSKRSTAKGTGKRCESRTL